MKSQKNIFYAEAHEALSRCLQDVTNEKVRRHLQEEGDFVLNEIGLTWSVDPDPEELAAQREEAEGALKDMERTARLAGKSKAVFNDMRPFFEAARRAIAAIGKGTSELLADEA